MRAAATVALFAVVMSLSGCSDETPSSPIPPPSPLSVIAISPTTGFSGFVVSISGRGFAVGATITMGGTPATGVSFLSGTQLRATAPGGITGPVDVVVINPNGDSATLRQAFKFELVTLSASTTLVSSGGRIDVNWTSSIQRPSLDWIGFFPLSASNYEYDNFWWDYVVAGTSGTLT